MAPVGDRPTQPDARGLVSCGSAAPIPLLGWRAVRQDPAFTTAHVPGNHRTLFEEPHVTEVLDRITEFVVPIMSGASTAVG
jgi:thioesterase domain-containing protein